MILGSHNTMSYLEPVWYMRWARKYAQCQTMAIDEQLENEVRAFDLRIRFSLGGMPHFAHGLVSFKSDITPYEVIKTINFSKKGNRPIYVRLVLETFFNASWRQRLLFTDFCDRMISMFPDIKFRVCVKTPWSTHQDDFDKEYREPFKGIHTLKELLNGPYSYLNYQTNNIRQYIIEGYDGICSEDFI